MMKRVLLAALALSYSFVHAEGFGAGTLVQTPLGYKNIEQLRCGDTVAGGLYAQGKSIPNKVTCTQCNEIDHFLRITIGNEILDVSSEQKLFIPGTPLTITAQMLHDSVTLQRAFAKKVPFVAVEEVNEKKVVYLLTVEQAHIFYVTKHNILVHNFFPIIAFGFAFGGGIELLTGVTFTALATSVCLWLAGKVSGSVKTRPNVQTPPPSSPQTPDDDPEKKKNERDEKRQNHQPPTNKKAREAAKDIGYKETKNHPCRNTKGNPVFEGPLGYISPDKTGHKGGFWKLFDKVSGEIKYTMNKTLTEIIKKYKK